MTLSWLSLAAPSRFPSEGAIRWTLLRMQNEIVPTTPS